MPVFQTGGIGFEPRHPHVSYKDKDAQRAYQRNWMAARRASWIQENGPCALCDSWEQLEVDHVDPATKVMQPSALWSLAPDNPKRIQELLKCRVLCHDCHDVKARKEKAFGERSGMTTLTRETVREIRRLSATGMYQREIARLCNTTQPTVSRIVRGQVWGRVL